MTLQKSMHSHIGQSGMDYQIWKCISNYPIWYVYLHIRFVNSVCITRFGRAFRIGQFINSYVKMKLVMGEKDDRNGNLKGKRNVCVKKEETNYNFNIFYSKVRSSAKRGSWAWIKKKWFVYTLYYGGFLPTPSLLLTIPLCKY